MKSLRSRAYGTKRAAQKKVCKENILESMLRTGEVVIRAFAKVFFCKPNLQTLALR